MSHSYHMEARIKAERLKLWEERKRRGEVATGEKPPDEDVVFSYTPSPDRVLVTDPGQFYLIRPGKALAPLPMFRVNMEGHCNRYQNRHHLNPHVDQAYATIYSDKDNLDYVLDKNQVQRRMNKALDKYMMSRVVNGNSTGQKSVTEL